MGKECWVGKEGRHAKLCPKSEETGRLGGTEKLWLPFMSWGGNWCMGTCPRAPFQLRPRSHLRGERRERKKISVWIARNLNGARVIAVISFLLPRLEIWQTCGDGGGEGGAGEDWDMDG